MKTISRDWDWWAYFFRVRHREQVPGIEEYDRQLIEFIAHVLDLRPGQRVLDLACGSGVHALMLARRGIEAIGLDIAPSLVAYATGRAQAEGVPARYVVGDMRWLGFAAEFDAVTILSTSFGFFDHQGNMAVLDGISRALKAGGRFLIDLIAPEIMARQRDTWWCELDGGYLLMRNRFDPATRCHHGEFWYIGPQGQLNVFEEDGEARHEIIHIYNRRELEVMITAAGLEFLAAYGSQRLPLQAYEPGLSSRLMVVGRRGIRE